MATLVLVTAAWAFSLLTRATDWMPALKFVVLGLGIAAAALLLLPPRGRRLSIAVASIALVATLLAPVAYTLQTVSTGHSGSIVTAGPTVAGSGFGRGGGGRPGGFGGAGQGGPQGQATGQTGGATGTAGTAGGFPGGGAGGGAGGLLNESVASSAVTTTLSADSASYTWVAAAVGSNRASGYQLATGLAVMPIGGFNGSDPSPTLAEFKQLVADGRIHYFIAGSQGTPNGGSQAGSDIEAWVVATFTATDVDGTTLYDLSQATGS
jgi:hypothetical protein